MPLLLAPVGGWGALRAILGAFGPLFIKMANEWQLNFNKKKILPPTPPTAAPPIYQPWLMAIEWQLNFKKKKFYPPPPDCSPPHIPTLVNGKCMAVEFQKKILHTPPYIPNLVNCK